MPRAAFLDTGVILGYCFTVDHHHHDCKTYLNTNGIDFFTSPTVESEYDSTRHKLNTRYSEAVLDHVSDLEQSDYEGQLDPVDLDKIKSQVLSRSNSAYDVLYQYYDEVVPQFILVEEVVDQLHNLARDIEQTAQERKQEIDSEIRIWSVSENYDSLREVLDSLHEPDQTICVEGHDLAHNLSIDTELATANPNDFVKDGQREVILSNTDLDDINVVI